MAPPPENDAPPQLARRSFFTLVLAGGLGSLFGCAEPQRAAPSAGPATQADEPLLQDPQLQQLLAPIALHPDDLVALILMASTYPLEVVQAQRWREQPANANLKGDALGAALEQMPWDTSVKSLTAFPEILNMMAARLEWTQQVGDAMLAQPSAVLAAIQTLRSRARGAGTLKPTPQQSVSGQDGAIVIAPTEAETIYIPYYDPNVVYGSWPYPAYPPYYYPWPGWGYYGGAVAAGVFFGIAIGAVGGYWGWAGCGWGGGNININGDRIRRVEHYRSEGAGGRWQHRPEHRQGVAYRNGEVRNRYQGDRQRGAAGRETFRGRTPQSGGLSPGDRRGGPGGLQDIGRGGDARAASRRGNASRPSFGGGGGRGFGGGRGGGGRGRR